MFLHKHYGEVETILLLMVMRVSILVCKDYSFDDASWSEPQFRPTSLRRLRAVTGRRLIHKYTHKYLHTYIQTYIRIDYVLKWLSFVCVCVCLFVCLCV